MTEYAIVGSAGKDVHYRIRDFRELPSVFRKYHGHSIPFSKIQKLLGKKWHVEKVMNLLEGLAVNHNEGNFSYGGRAFTIACQAAKLGADVTIIGEVGDDFDTHYAGFSDGSYRNHIRNCGVSFSVLPIEIDDDICEEPSLLREILCRTPGIGNAGILQFRGREIPTILAVKDTAGTDIFFFDDTNAASKVGRYRPVPTEVLKNSRGIFITSGDTEFNARIAQESRLMDLEVIFDVGLFEATPNYMRSIVPNVDILLGNTKEIAYVCSAFSSSSVEDFFNRTKHLTNPKVVIKEDKIDGRLTIYERTTNKKQTIGPINIRKTGSSTGVCDCIGAGFLVLHSKGCSVLESCQAGLTVGSAIWEVEGIHEGFLDSNQFEERWVNHWGRSALTRIKRNLKNPKRIGKST